MFKTDSIKIGLRQKHAARFRSNRAGILFAAVLALCASRNYPGTARGQTGDEAIAALDHWLALPRADRPALGDQPFGKVPLSKKDAEIAQDHLWRDYAGAIRANRAAEWKDKVITLGEHSLRLKERQFGVKPKDGWSLFISMHGGGNTTPAVNDQQWENQIRLYEPKEGLVIAPRAPTDTWNLWHEAHIDALFQRLLADAFVLGDVNPNRVYLMGYSAGGDGVYQLAPRMADRWAAASMMAGHPNDASPLGLRDLPFAIHVGALDDGYHRNAKALEWKKVLDALHTADPAGYTHVVQLHEGRAHWMNREDAVAVEWMAGFTRDPFPAKVVWKQSPVTHDRFYWLAVPEKSAVPESLLVVSREHQQINIEKADGVDRFNILLNDKMLNLDEPVKVEMNGRELFAGVAARTIAAIEHTLVGRGDPTSVFDAEIPLTIAPPK